MGNNLQVDKSDLQNIYRKIVINSDFGWVLFKHGTCVVLDQANGIEKQATKKLLQDQRFAGTPAADLHITEIENAPGWIVVGGNPDVLVYVSPEEIKEQNNQFLVGLTAISKKELDQKDPKIIHTEGVNN